MARHKIRVDQHQVKLTPEELEHRAKFVDWFWYGVPMEPWPELTPEMPSPSPPRP